MPICPACQQERKGLVKFLDEEICTSCETAANRMRNYPAATEYLFKKIHGESLCQSATGTNTSAHEKLIADIKEAIGIERLSNADIPGIVCRMKEHQDLYRSVFDALFYDDTITWDEIEPQEIIDEIGRLQKDTVAHRKNNQNITAVLESIGKIWSSPVVLLDLPELFSSMKNSLDSLKLENTDLSDKEHEISNIEMEVAEVLGKISSTFGKVVALSDLPEIFDRYNDEDKSNDLAERISITRDMVEISRQSIESACGAIRATENGDTPLSTKHTPYTTVTDLYENWQSDHTLPAGLLGELIRNHEHLENKIIEFKRELIKTVGQDRKTGERLFHSLAAIEFYLLRAASCTARMNEAA